MSVIPPAPTAEDHICRFRKSAVSGDVAGMAAAIGELHAQWDTLSQPLQAETRRLDAILLSVLNAHIRRHQGTSPA